MIRNDLPTLQKNIIQTFLDVFQGPSLTTIAKETGLDKTRIFRIVSKNKEMYVSEYELFHSAIKRRLKKASRIS